MSKKTNRAKDNQAAGKYRNNTALFIDGKRNEFSGNESEAVKIFKKVLDADPDNHAAAYELSKIYVDNRGGGNIAAAMSASQAEDYALTALAENPENKWYALNLVKFYCLKGDIKKAGSAGKKYLEIEQNNINNYYKLYNVYAKCSDYENALSVLDELEKRFGFNAAFALKMKDLYVHEGRYRDAEAVMKKMIEHYPSKKEYYGMMADILMAQGKRHKAVDFYKKILEIDPADGKVHIVLASYYNSVGDRRQSFDELKKAFGSTSLDVDQKVKMMMKLYRITADNPQDTLLKLQSDTLLFILNNVNGDNPKVLAMEGDYLSRDKKWKEARWAYEQVISIDSTKYPVWEQLILICNEMKDYGAMQNYSRRALALFPQYSIVYYFNALADYRMADYKEAEASLNLGLSFVYKKAQKLEFYTLMGIVRDSLHQYKSAEIAFENVMIEDANYAPGLKAYALHLVLTGEDAEKAETFAKKALELNYNSPEYIFAYAKVLFFAGKTEEAQKWTKKGLELAPDNKDLNLLMGEILLRLGDKSGAARFLKKGGKK